MAALDDILRCTYGSSSFQLSDYSYSVDPVVKDGLGRTGTKFGVAAKGWVEGSDPADFASKLAQVNAALLTFGQDFRVYGLGGAMEIEILASKCIDYGPHVAFKFKEQQGGSALIKEVEFTLSATASFDAGTPGGVGGVQDGFGVTTEVKTDGLRRVTRKGSVTGTPATATYQNTVLTTILNTYPKTRWVAAQRYETNSTDSYLTYEITLEEIRQPFLSTTEFEVLDGDYVQRVARDESNRKVTTVSFDFAYTGDLQKLLTALRPPGQIILSERWDDQRYKDRRFRGEITFVESAQNDQQTAWEQSLQLDDESNAVSAASIPGRDAQMFYGIQPPRRAVQSGRAVGLKIFCKPWPPFWPNYMSKPADIRLRKVNEVEYEVAWRYEFVFPSSVPLNLDIVNQLNRPQGSPRSIV